MSKSSEMIRRREVFDVVSDVEGDMRKVRDLALILHELLSDSGGITKEMQQALVHLTGDLYSLGSTMNDLCDRLYELGGVAHIASTAE